MSKTNWTNIGAALKAARTESGLSQAALAEASGVTKTLIGQMERGTKRDLESLGVCMNTMMGKVKVQVLNWRGAKLAGEWVR